MQQDFAEIGLNTVQKRRLMRTIRGNQSTSSNAATAVPAPEAEPPVAAAKQVPTLASTTQAVSGSVEEAEPPTPAKQDSPSMNVYISPFLRGQEVSCASRILTCGKMPVDWLGLAWLGAD